MTDSRGLSDPQTAQRVQNALGPGASDPMQPQPVEANRLFELFDTERKASFLYPGGIVAVHAKARDRQSIWDALMRREVYGTSGPRILLWFDLLNAPAGRRPMGSESTLRGAPRFEVRAVGSLQEQPGCPQEVLDGLSPDRVHALCRDECHHPGETRIPIDAIEVIRVRPQRNAHETIAPLIEDPWRRFDCAPDPAGCRVTFTDSDFPASGRDALYYVRALQQATPAINAANLRTRFDAKGNAISIDECHGGGETPQSDDCLSPAQERAWSSPIYVDQAAS